MNNIATLIMLPLFLFSCGTTPEKKKGELDYDNFSNEEFKAPEKVKYSIDDDFLDKGLTDDRNVLFEESISKVDAEELEDFEDIEKPLVKALVACYQGKYQEADQIFDRFLRPFRSNPIYWTQVGNCFLKKGKSRKALLYYNKAKELRKVYGPPVNNIGVILERKGMPQKALKAYEEAMNMASFSLTPLFNTAQLYVRFGLVKEAENLLLSLRQIESKDGDTLSSLAYVEMIKGNYKKSLSYYHAMTRNDRIKNPSNGANYALTLYLSGQKKLARKVVDKIKGNKSARLENYILQIENLL